jgi:hypothetical protein
MLPGNVVFEDILLHLLATLSAFEHFLGTLGINMNLDIALLHPSTAVEWALHLEFVYNLAKAHVWLEPWRQLDLTIRTHLWIALQRAETPLAKDGPALLAVKR